MITDDIVRELKWLRVQMESALEQYECTGERRDLCHGRSQSQEIRRHSCQP